MAQDPLNRPNGDIGPLQDRRPEVPQGMEAKMSHASPLTEGSHEVLPVLVGTLHEPTDFPAPVPTPKVAELYRRHGGLLQLTHLTQIMFMLLFRLLLMLPKLAIIY
jgi:hypothetical protein